MSNGFYLSKNVYVDGEGDIWKYVSNLSGLPGLGITSGTWTKIGEMITPLIGAVATRIAGSGGIRGVEVAPPAGAGSGAQLVATSSGIFGNIDTTTLLMLGGLAVGAFLIMKK